MSDILQLPNGDLWRKPTINTDGSAEPSAPRPDTVDISALPAKTTMSPDVAAILMNDLERQRAAAAAAAAKQG